MLPRVPLHRLPRRRTGAPPPVGTVLWRLTHRHRAPGHERVDDAPLEGRGERFPCTEVEVGPDAVGVPGLLFCSFVRKTQSR